MASLTFAASTIAIIESTEVLLDIARVLYIQGLSGSTLLQNNRPVILDGLSAELLLQNNRPIPREGLSGSIILEPPTYSYYRIAATAYNIEPPEEPS